MLKRPIEQIHEIELSSRCNLACVYCPNPTMKRPKVDMDWPVFARALEHVYAFCERETQGELALTGVGEALLHPRFIEAVYCARDVIGATRPLTFSTNGILLTAELLRELRSADPIIYVSVHRPEVAGPAIELLRSSGLRFGVNTAFVDSALDWAGTVDWHVSHSAQVCAYLRDGWAVIRADGTVGSCCWDAESDSGRLGTVWDAIGSFMTQPHALCASCSLTVPDDALAVPEHV